MEGTVKNLDWTVIFAFSYIVLEEDAEALLSLGVGLLGLGLKDKFCSFCQKLHFQYCTRQFNPKIAQSSSN